MAEPKKDEMVSIIIPAYNEKASLENVARDIRSSIGDAFAFEIIVVNDGSTDGLDIAPYINLIDQFHIHKDNMGYGAAIKTGLRNSKGEKIVIIDADGTYPSSAIPALVKALDHSEMAVGSRTGSNVKIPLLRQPAKFILGLLANYLAERKIPDLNSGLRAFRKKEAEPFNHILPRGFSFTTTLTLAFLCNDLRVEYIPIDYHKRTGESKIRPIRDTKNILLTIIRTIVYFNPLKVCLPISVLFFLLAIGVLCFSLFALDKVMDGTISVLTLSGAQVLAIGLLADLIARRSGR
ncbi:glycosyltransferase family 2 protein [Candidatus Sumerlaeota bacterium]|nr:glycosyltransferase family 2 protein [Candidatus Sumerlaeota bacterium]